MADVLDQSEVDALLDAVDFGEDEPQRIRRPNFLSGAEDDIFHLDIKNYQRTRRVFSGELNLRLGRYEVQAQLDINALNAVRSSYKFGEFYEIAGFARITDTETGDTAYHPVDRILDKKGAYDLISSLMDQKKLARSFSEVEKASERGYMSRRVLMSEQKKTK